MAYRIEATTIEGFVQQIACSYLRHGYWFYVTGIIPPGKEPQQIDAKLLAKYSIGVSEATRRRRKQAGMANLQLIRHERFFVILATKGRHGFFEAEQGRIRDIRTVPLKHRGYSISYRRGGRTRKGEKDTRWHAHVEIEREKFLNLQAEYLTECVRRSAASLALRFYEVGFERYAPIRRQLLILLKRVNAKRKLAGLEPVPTDALSLRRRIVKPFVTGIGGHLAIE